ncbi:plasma protease C1 inhibitor [Poecilia reticulata]|uniref:Serpin peptidase inhibitor, clade G (C1 inhibitor), member 1 n=1 Tax=Poecilia reticulata TaxID=8081 RepID=A0A3P9NTC5_POERE|nr:PREDICTED: plasma protease C1 inhibitor [Poecilia reticulata]
MKHQAMVCLLLWLTFEPAPCMHIRTSQGSMVELPCYTSESDIPDAKITWTFNGQNISDTALSPGSAKHVKKGFYVSISSVSAASEGEYVCVAVWEQGEATTTYSLTVESFHTTVKVTEDSTAYLPCYLPSSSEDGNISNAKWFKETGVGKKTRLNTEEDDSGDAKIELVLPNDQDQTIMIKKTNMGDAGVYICESAEGKRLNSLQLEVEALPKSSCKDLIEGLVPCQDENSRTAEPILQESMTEFAMKLYSHLKQEEPLSNILFSPVSISAMLAHLLLGATGNTHGALKRALCVPLDFNCVHSLMKKQKEKMGQSLQMASQIYYNPQMNLSESFLSQSFEYYGAEPTKLLESSEENMRMINAWVANKTNNKITNIINDVSPNTQLILLNAVSFSGQWKFKFNDKPKKGLFVKFGGDMVRVPLIHHSRYLATMTYAPDLKAQVGRFALTGDNSLYILLPFGNNLSDLQQMEDKMTDVNVHQIIELVKAVQPQNLEVTLPQVKLDVEPNMNMLLKKLGLSSLFEGPSLCGLSSNGDLVLDDAKHKAFLALTERGVEAGAVTSLSFSRSFPTFSALRPFVLLLWNDQANVPLFIGRVLEP